MGSRDLNTTMLLSPTDAFTAFGESVSSSQIQFSMKLESSAEKAMLTFLNKKQEERWEWSRFACGGL